MFRIILTVVTIIGAIGDFATVWKEREPVEIQEACIGMIFRAVVLYGFWHWL